MEEQKIVYDVNEIQKIIPHRYPFLLIDKIIEFVDNESIIGIKNVTMNEAFFQGHFPGRPIMPGVLILEAMAQTGAIMALKSSNGVTEPGKILVLVGATDVRWRKPVVPGDTMRIEMVFTKSRRPLWMMDGKVIVDDKIVASASLSAAES